MVSVRTLLRKVPDPRGRKGRQHPLEALLGLILLSMLSGRQGMAAAFRLGRSLTRRQLARLGFRPERRSPCHATLTETLRMLDPDAMAALFSTVIAPPTGGSGADTDPHQVAIDGKTLRGSKDAEGRAEHVLSAFLWPSGAIGWACIIAKARGWKSQMHCAFSTSSTYLGRW